MNLTKVAMNKRLSYLIYPLTARVVGAPEMISQPLHCILGLGELQACPFPDVIFPPLPLSALSSSPFHCALQDGFGLTWWTGDITRTRSFSGADIGSDLDLLMMTSHFRLKRISKPKHTRLKSDLEKLKDPNVLKTFQTMIGGSLHFSPSRTMKI